jgi:hypothetical protein
VEKSSMKIKLLLDDLSGIVDAEKQKKGTSGVQCPKHSDGTFTLNIGESYF